MKRKFLIYLTKCARFLHEFLCSHSAWPVPDEHNCTRPIISFTSCVNWFLSHVFSADILNTFSCSEMFHSIYLYLNGHCEFMGTRRAVLMLCKCKEDDQSSHHFTKLTSSTVSSLLPLLSYWQTD